MIKTTLSQLAPYLNARLVGGDAEVSVVYTDSRQVCVDGLFVALRGPHFDAHDFLPQVLAQKAKGVVVEKESALDIPQLVVENCKLALGDLAKYNRASLNAKVVAITGSSGKTTVKEMVASILQNVGQTYATKGNFNNDIGAPLTLLEVEKTHDFAVVELGANHPGEIAYTAGIAQPDVALINNVAAAHLQGFGDLQGVARAKGEIFSALDSDGTAIVNNDDEFADFWKKKINCQILSYATQNNADVVANNIQLDADQCPQFEIEFKGKKSFVHLPLAGMHNVNNALAASACCLALGVSLTDICLGLSQAPVVTGRLNNKMMSNGCRVIDDTYNANLDSMKAAINLLAEYDGRKILVIGDMAELGEFGRQCHEQVGVMAKEASIDLLFSCGVLTQFSQLAFAGKGKHFSSQQKLIQQLLSETSANTTILVKGSRSAHMEKVVEALINSVNAEPHDNNFTLQQEDA